MDLIPLDADCCWNLMRSFCLPMASQSCRTVLCGRCLEVIKSDKERRLRGLTPPSTRLQKAVELRYSNPSPHISVEACTADGRLFAISQCLL